MSLARAFLDRTADGVAAFRAAAAPQPARPLRTAYVAASAASVLAAATGKYKLTNVVKPTLMPLLAADLVTRGQLTTGRKILLAGLVGGWVGDIVLMSKASRSRDGQERLRNLNKGAAAFITNQFAYHAVMWRKGARPEQQAALVRLPVVLGGIGLSLWKAPTALPAAGGYGSALAFTSVLGEHGSLADSVAGKGVSHGANLFVLSDSLILGRMTLLKNKGVVDKLADGAVMATYTAAQLLLVDGLAD